MPRLRLFDAFDGSGDGVGAREGDGDGDGFRDAAADGEGEGGDDSDGVGAELVTTVGGIVGVGFGDVGATGIGAALAKVAGAGTEPGDPPPLQPPSVAATQRSEASTSVTR